MGEKTSEKPINHYWLGSKFLEYCAKQLPSYTVTLLPVITCKKKTFHVTA